MFSIDAQRVDNSGKRYIEVVRYIHDVGRCFAVTSIGPYESDPCELVTILLLG
jgi:hypothetical protein